ncbi:MAG TPA: hypothetical protein VNI57_11280, partial [Candidatus Saccharimonadales bacterium]|nr:hypothetical protein [Candidatus Saccharimonadales bacterium]
MSLAGVDAALQASAQGAGSTLTLDAWGLAGLLILLAGALAGAGAGWALYAMSRRGAGALPRAEPPREERPIQPPPVAPAVEPPPVKPSEDPVIR